MNLVGTMDAHANFKIGLVTTTNLLGIGNSRQKFAFFPLSFANANLTCNNHQPNTSLV